MGFVLGDDAHRKYIARHSVKDDLAVVEERRVLPFAAKGRDDRKVAVHFHVPNNQTRAAYPRIRIEEIVRNLIGDKEDPCDDEVGRHLFRVLGHFSCGSTNYRVLSSSRFPSGIDLFDS